MLPGAGAVDDDEQQRDGSRRSGRALARSSLPYWRRLALVLALSLASTGALAVPAAPLARLLRRRAARPRSAHARPHRRAVRARLDRQLRAERRSAGCATRACRRTSCSTCGWRCTAICSGCRRASTRARGSATSCRASTTTSARSSASPPRPRWPGSATCCSSSARSACWPGSTCGCSLVAVRPRRSAIWALVLLPRPARGARAACCASAAPTSAAS